MNNLDDIMEEPRGLEPDGTTVAQITASEWEQWFIDHLEVDDVAIYDKYRFKMGASLFPKGVGGINELVNEMVSDRNDSRGLFLALAALFMTNFDFFIKEDDS